MSRPALVTAVLLLWLAAWGWSVIGFRLAEPAADDVTRGMNRVTLFLVWQAVAAALAVAAFFLGSGLARGALRLASRVPILMAAALVITIAGAILWARFVAAP